MNKQYLIRLDDACSSMNYVKWHRMESVLDKYEIRPMVGVIPCNEDPKQRVGCENKSFWGLVESWRQKGWTIALHGYNHCYTSQKGLVGMNPMWEKSEFSGLPLEEQRKKINKGVAIFRKHGINPRYFFAPSHTFDENTLTALREESDIRIISDTIATKPYQYKGFVFIPQFSGHCREMILNGVFTFCFHPNTMVDSDFHYLEKFLSVHQNEFVCFEELELKNVPRKGIFDMLLSFCYFTLRRLRGLK